METHNYHQLRGIIEQSTQNEAITMGMVTFKRDKNVLKKNLWFPYSTIRDIRHCYGYQSFAQETTFLPVSVSMAYPCFFAKKHNIFFWTDVYCLHFANMAPGLQ